MLAEPRDHGFEPIALQAHFEGPNICGHSVPAGQGVCLRACMLACASMLAPAAFLDVQVMRCSDGLIVARVPGTTSGGHCDLGG
mmetsp:Transcript_57760/g.179396  ORF Transcript_57760/g.179396 Transcript_57760/m.179396 type:complete len:84 (+) Transcript_57760:357-608(+)